MRGRTPGLALRAYQNGLQRAQTSIATANQVIIQPTHENTYDVRPPQQRLLVVRHSEIRFLQFQIRVAVEQRGDSSHDRWQVIERVYHYAFLDADEREILAFHWHPHVPRQPEPHIHLGPASGAVALLRETHIPAPRLGLDGVLRFAIVEAGVTPVREDWPALLTGDMPPG